MTQVRSAGTAPKLSRAESYARVAALRVAGLNGIQIARELGISSTYVYDLLGDPDGGGVRKRKAGYRGVCESCGGPTDGSGGPANVPRFCRHCAGGAYARWDPARIVSKIQEWIRLYGGQPRATDWSPALAAACLSPERAATAHARYASGEWPATNTVRAYFGSWNAGLAAAGCDIYLGRRRIKGAA